MWCIRICCQDNECRPSGTDGPATAVPTGSGKRGATLRMPQLAVLPMLAAAVSSAANDVQPWTFRFAKLSKASPWTGEWTVVAVTEEVVDGRVRFTQAVLSRCDGDGAVAQRDVCLADELRLSTRRAGLAGRLMPEAIEQCVKMDDPHCNRARAAERAEHRTPKWQHVHSKGGFSAASGDSCDLAGAEEQRMP